MAGKGEAGAAAAAEEDGSRAARTPRAPWTPRVGLSVEDLFESTGTLKEPSRTSGRQRYLVFVYLFTLTARDKQADSR